MHVEKGDANTILMMSTFETLVYTSLVVLAWREFLTHLCAMRVSLTFTAVRLATIHLRRGLLNLKLNSISTWTLI